MRFRIVWLFSVIWLALAACTSTAPESSETVRVMASTSIIGDVVQQVAGEHVAVEVLIPRGQDPHGFEPTPQLMAQLQTADVIFINGLGLEAALEKMLDAPEFADRVVALGEDVPVLLPVEADGHEEEDHDEAHDEAHADEHAHGPYDPHVWFDPRNVAAWADHIADTLATLDPAHADAYRANAAEYRRQLDALDAWIREQVALVPPERRILITDHAVLGYYANAYGFQQVATVIPGVSTLAEPSAQALSQLYETIRAYNVPAIFVSEMINRRVVERVVQDTGVQMVLIYTGSLSAPDGPAPTYEELMRYDTTVIVDALRGVE